MMIKYTPKSKNKAAMLSVIMLITSSFVFFVFASVVMRGLVLRFLAGLFIMAAILIVSRYSVCTFIYILEDNDFVIIKNNWGKSVALCRIAYKDLLAITDKKGVKRADIKKVRRYNYCITMFCPQPRYILFEVCNEKGLIMFEPDAYFLSELNKRVLPGSLNLDL